jgi:hypothetical protein
MEVMRDNPDTLQNAVQTAMNEENLRARFNLRIQTTNIHLQDRYLRIILK